MARQIHYNAAEHIAAETAPDPYARPAFSAGNRMQRMMWNVCWGIFYRFSPRPFFAWRAQLLRMFGAKLGPTCKFCPSSRVWAPWNLMCGDLVAVGDGAEIYNPAPVRVGSHAILSQDSYLCGATHDFDDPAFPLLAYANGRGTVCVDLCAGLCGAGSERGRGRGAGTGVGGDARPGAVGGVCGIACGEGEGAEEGALGAGARGVRRCPTWCSKLLACRNQPSQPVAAERQLRVPRLVARATRSE